MINIYKIQKTNNILTVIVLLKSYNIFGPIKKKTIYFSYLNNIPACHFQYLLLNYSFVSPSHHNVLQNDLVYVDINLFISCLRINLNNEINNFLFQL